MRPISVRFKLLGRTVEHCVLLAPVSTVWFMSRAHFQSATKEEAYAQVCNRARDSMCRQLVT
jgi:hypothetical protein